MQASEEITAAILWNLGPIQITATVVTTWGIMLALFTASFIARARLVETPGRMQSALEGIVVTIEHAISAVTPEHASRILPFIATLWVFLVIANLSGLIPGLHAPTRDLSATAALAFLVFLSVHWFGIRTLGWKAYLHHYISPNPVLLPFHLISEVTRTIALAVRLFGNMLSLEMTALFILIVAGFLAPVPIMMLHIIEALVQAYIFGMLALIYVAGGIQSFEISAQRRQRHD